MCLSLQIAAREHLRELVLLRRVRDRIDREPTLDVEALADSAGMAAGDFLRRFRDAYGQSPHAYQRTARAVRTRTFDRVLETR
ncbi:AraC family transcriptional regulator [Amycolatopsis sp. NPDC051371]|uniref:AraC family transcriptional regulator n=1 Tax=Amycolatopsis sp. NPDC051371 TaxID=3155800 RepID=UPI00344A11CF